MDLNPLGHFATPQLCEPLGVVLRRSLYGKNIIIDPGSQDLKLLFRGTC